MLWKMRLLIIICLIVSVAACSPLTATSSPTSSPEPAASATLEATNTSQPSATLSPTVRVKTATPTPETPTQTPVLEETIMAVQVPSVSPALISPDRKWRAEVMSYDCTPFADMGDYALERLMLVQEGGGDRIVDQQLLACGGLGAFGLEPLFWSPNSLFLYYTDAREGVPDGCGYWERSILRLDVTQWGLEKLGRGPLSPDGLKLATWQGMELVVWDIDGGEIGRVLASAPQSLDGPIAWSPDSKSLVYLQYASDCPFVSGKSNVVRLDLPELSAEILVESEAPSFGGVEWEFPDALRLFDENGVEWGYDFKTEELEVVK